MKKAICQKCNKIMRTVFEAGEKKYFCKYCDDFTDYEVKNVKNFCDKCGDELELLQACGSVSFFCHNCNEVRSRSVVDTRYFEIESE